MLTKTIETTPSLCAVTSQVADHLTETKKEEERDGRVTAQRTELKVAAHTAELDQVTQSWLIHHPTQFEIQNAPSAPALYPSLSTLEEGPVLQLNVETVKNGAKGPAVLALPEQESSPLSLQPLESVAELSTSKLYPELPKTVPEIQVIFKLSNEW